MRRAAFKGLAYKRYHEVPLYLEWAPRDIWESPAPVTATAAAALASKSSNDKDNHGGDGGGADHGGDGDAGGGDDTGSGGNGAQLACIYVKNLNFKTADAALQRHFDAALSSAGGTLHSVKVARRKGPDGKLLSMGFGFVETDSEAAAKAAIKQLQGSLLDKHKLQLQLSKHGAPGALSSAAKRSAAEKAAAAAGKKAAGTKLVVRNVAFEATRKDLVGLFGPFGHIKSCRCGCIAVLCGTCLPAILPACRTVWTMLTCQTLQFASHIAHPVTHQQAAKEV